MPAMHADVSDHPKGIFDATGRPSAFEEKRSFDKLWSALCAKRKSVCKVAFRISPSKDTQAAWERVRDEIRPESTTKAAEDFSALTSHLSNLGSQLRESQVQDIAFKIRQDILWIQSITLWEQRCRDKEIYIGGAPATRQERKRSVIQTNCVIWAHNF
jgi:hypothetical protein